MKKHWSTILLVLILAIGLSLMLYPTIADWWNDSHQARMINSYSDVVAGINNEKYAEIWSAAWEYNQSLLERSNDFLLSDEQKNQYMQLLNIEDTGIMGYIKIPVIGVTLPICHGTGEDVLQVAVGHLEWTSLPVGGTGSHCVLSGHSGLPSARLFTDLEKVAEGDTFMLYVLDEKLTYEVDQICVVEPGDTDELMIIEGEDLCTLVTCTPYGINSHRLLVRGHRVETVDEPVRVRITVDAVRISPAVMASPVLIVLLLWFLIPKSGKDYRDNLREQTPKQP